MVGGKKQQKTPVGEARWWALITNIVTLANLGISKAFSYAFPIWSSQPRCEVGIINILLRRKLMLRGTWDLAPTYQGPQAGPDDLHRQAKLLITHLSSHCRGQPQNSWWEDGLGKHWEEWLGKTPRKTHRTLAGWSTFDLAGDGLLILQGLAPDHSPESLLSIILISETPNSLKLSHLELLLCSTHGEDNSFPA